MKKVHLVCNAHIDPVWLWRWDEGAAEAISTFRVAADFCESYDGFVFNHNEVILYQWIEEYEPTLFARIQRLVAQGKWHIMGGWYLQPDCNMVTGEGIVRQIEVGRKYFYEKFGVVPTTAINFDSFGHARGLVQILKKTGYDSYLFCRPLRVFNGVVRDEWGYDSFSWVGYDGSTVKAHRNWSVYCTPYGEAVNWVEDFLKDRAHLDKGLMLWGIGNHGGGPSKVDLEAINALIAKQTDCDIVHSTPEEYFASLDAQELPQKETGLNSWAPGCYTTQAEIKRRYRTLESELFLTEKMSAAASAAGMEYPTVQLKEAEQDMLFTQFHDIIPGTLVPRSMEDSLASIAHGADILAKAKTKAFFALAKGQAKAGEGEIPIMAYNPHPYPVEGNFDVEFNLHKQYPQDGLLRKPIVMQNGVEIPCQLEQEESNMVVQWRRKVVFHATLPPMQMSRFDCKIVEVPVEPFSTIDASDTHYTFQTETLTAKINLATGLLDALVVNGTDALAPNAFRPLIIADDDHSIGTFVESFPDVCGQFTLLSPSEAVTFCGVMGESLAPVHLIEDGAVRTVIEAVFGWENSRLCMRYYLPKQGTQVEVETIVHWNENNKMLKLSIPTALENTRYVAQTMDGYDEVYQDGKEVVAQKWGAMVSQTSGQALAIINDATYGSSFEDGELRLTLLRAPRYGCLTPRHDRALMFNRGYVPHTDQGVHTFHFWLEAGKPEQLLPALARKAQAKSEKPYVLSFFPSGMDAVPASVFSVADDCIVANAFKKAVRPDCYLLRLYNPQAAAVSTTLTLHASGSVHVLHFTDCEIKTLVLNLTTGAMEETDMLENQYKTL